MSEFGSNLSTGDSAPFNMAIATLMRIDKLLLDIKQISNVIALGDDESEGINKASALGIKITLARQLFINAVPLIPEKSKGNLKTEMDNLKVPIVKKIYNSSNPSESSSVTGESYDNSMDRQVDDFLIHISEILQKEGYFMPPKNDPRFAFKRD